MLRCLTMLILLMLVVVGVLAYLALSAPPAVAPTLQATPTEAAAPPAATAVIPQQAANSFDQKVGAFEKAVTSGGQKPVELVLTQQEIASKIQQMLASSGGSEFQNVGVQLQDGAALITGSTSVAGLTVPVQATAHLSASGGMLGVNVTSVKTGNLDLPQAVVEQITQRIQQAAGLNSLKQIDVGINVQTVQVTPTQVKIAGMTR